MKYYRLLYLIFLFYCIEPYDFEVLSTERILVVDGSMTNVPGEQFVKLTYSYGLLNSTPDVVVGAQVCVTDDLGNSVDFLETTPGTYEPGGAYAGEIGRSYQLKVTTPDGNEYRSSLDELNAPASIQSIYGRFLSLPIENEFKRGIQFFVDVDGIGQDNYSYRFEYEEDYEFRVPLGSRYVYDEDLNDIVPRDTIPSVCYVNEKSRDLLIATTGGQVSSELKEFPLVYVTEEEPELIYRYSLLVKSFRIAPEAYQYYKDLQENNESAGSFFDRQKGVFVGNVQNVNDPSDLVLGYFEVAGVSQDFQIFDGNTWDDDDFRVRPILTNCFNQVDSVAIVDILDGGYFFGERNIWNLGDSTGEGLDVNTAFVASRICTDCRAFGVLKRPSFWD